MAKERIQTVRVWVEEGAITHAANYREVVQRFVHALRENAAFKSLPPYLQGDLIRLPDEFHNPDPQRIAEKLRTEWAKAVALQRRVESGECLTNFGGHFRIMGATGNAQYWVIRPDGSEREPDGISYRKRYVSEGGKNWRLVGPEELAISWFKACTAAGHEFIVNKLPVGECTVEQLATVKRLEREINERFRSAVSGWDLRKKPKP